MVGLLPFRIAGLLLLSLCFPAVLSAESSRPSFIEEFFLFSSSPCCDTELGPSKNRPRISTPHPADKAFSAFQRGYYLTARQLALQAASQGCAASQTLLGELYARGLGLKADPSEAAKWYSLASDRGDPAAQTALGLLYAQGTGVNRDLFRATELFERAAAQGQAAAQYNLGLIFLRGQTRPRDPQRAKELLRRAAQKGHVQAQYDLGLLYQETALDEADQAEATRWIGFAARNGLSDAALEYGLLLFKGTGIAKNEAQGAMWLKRAARAGNPIAQNRVAHFHARGLYATHDLVEAAKWHFLARAKGRKDPTLDVILKYLSPQQKEVAEQAAGRWTPLRPPGPFPE